MWGPSGVYTHSLKAMWCLPQQNKPKGKCPFLHRTAECKGSRGRSPFAVRTAKSSWTLAHSLLEDSTCQVGYRRSTMKVGFVTRGQAARPTGLKRHTASLRRRDFLPTWKLLQRQRKCPLWLPYGQSRTVTNDTQCQRDRTETTRAEQDPRKQG